MPVIFKQFYSPCSTGSGVFDQGWMDRQTNGLTEGRTDRQTRWMAGWMDREIERYDV